MSAAIAFTQKGKDILLQSDLTLTGHPFEVVAEGQMHEAAPYHKWYEKVMRKLRQEDTTIDEVIGVLDRALVVERRKKQLRHPLSTIATIAKRLCR